jgi:nucleotide-binding universal stress UspA family protein
MYKHILVPTDGSKLAAKGVREAVGLAKDLGARISGVYVIAPFAPRLYSEGSAYVSRALSPRDYKALTEKEAKKALSVIGRAARAAGVRYAERITTEAQPWKGILRAARAGRCDLIVMGSHGRSALGGLMLGSETVRVLARSKIPVLVAR